MATCTNKLGAFELVARLLTKVGRLALASVVANVASRDPWHSMLTGAGGVK